MPMALTGSVGLGGRNVRSDVITVQTLLALRGRPLSSQRQQCLNRDDIGAHVSAPEADRPG